MISTLYAAVVKWLQDHKPDLFILIVIISITVFLAVKFTKHENTLNRVVEAIEHLEEKMDYRFAQVDERFDRVDARMDKMDARMDNMDDRFDKIDARFDKIDARFEKLERDMVEVKLLLKKIDTYLTTKDKNYHTGEE